MKRKWLFRLLFFVENIFSFEFLMSYFLGIQMDIMIGGMVGLKYARFNSFPTVISVLVSSLVVLFYGFVTVMITIKVHIFSKKNKDQIEELHKYSVHKKWDFLHIGVKKKLPFA